MQTVKVKIEGIAPLLVNRFKMPEEEREIAQRRDKVYDPVQDAEYALYKDDVIGCYAPSSWIEACLREAGKNIKASKGRESMLATVLSSIFVDPEKIPLNKETYDELDRRPAVIQNNRIVKTRPRFNTWELEFTVSFDEERIRKETLKQLLEEGGATKGIGDYRPKYGRFRVVSFQ